MQKCLFKKRNELDIVLFELILKMKMYKDRQIDIDGNSSCYSHYSKIKKIKKKEKTRVICQQVSKN